MRPAGSERRGASRLWLWCGAAGAPLFLVVVLIEDATRAGYDPLRLPISMLALGDGGWTQVLNFLVDGALLLAFAVGLARTFTVRGRGAPWGPRLVALVAVGVLGTGVFVTNSTGSYPPGTPQPVDPALHSTLHNLFSLAVFTGLPAACFVFAGAFRARGEPGWARYSALSGAATVLGFALLSLRFSGARGIADVAGLIQRVTVAVG